jgi:hypothetical protein
MGARRHNRQPGRAIALALAACLLPLGVTQAQFGPFQHDGYLEYQYRLNRSEGNPGFDTHLATWRAHASTWVWQPYILQLDGNLGLTRSTDSDGVQRRESSFVTGGLFAQLFPRSHFPFRAYYEARDTRVEGGLFDRDSVSNTWGFLQQYSARRGGRLSIDYRNADTDELFEDGIRAPRKFNSSVWQVNASKAFGKNDFRLLTAFRDLSRQEREQSEKRNTLSLRHRFRTSPRFFIEDTTFFSDERIALDGRDTARRFLQFNGMSTWRPETRRPLMVIMRALAQGADAGPVGLERGTTNLVLTGSANYQVTPNVTLSGIAGLTSADADEAEEENQAFQRLRAMYRSDSIPLGRLQYNWGASGEAGNRRETNGIDETTQDVAGNFSHSLSEVFSFNGGSQLQLSFSQQVAAIRDSQDRDEQSLVHSLFATWSRQLGRSSHYVRLSASDRRLSGDKDDTFQLVTLQGSSRMQVNRNRSLNGGITVQYNSTTATMWDDWERDNSSVTYSANFSYVERDLFKVPRLNFISELRLLSSDFRSNDILDQGIVVDPDRDDASWRNRLDYRVGLLELQLLAEVREINNSWMSQVFLSIRRHYGGRR